MGARIQLCGRLAVELGGERIEARLPGRQGPLVIAVLAVNRTRPVPRSELIDVLWPERLPADPEEALSALLSKVRHAVGRDVLTGRRDLALALPAGAEVDVERAASDAAAAEAAAAAGDHAAAWEAATRAAEVTGRGFLAGLDGPWVQQQRLEVEQLHLRALEAAAAAGVALGGTRLGAAERSARELVRLAPLRETGHRLLMEALAARGEAAEALGAYEALRVLLRDELGTAPGEAVRTLHERLLTGDLPRPRPPAAPPAPRRALPTPLTRRGGTAFVGRAGELDRLRRAWEAARAGTSGVVLLAGGPGIGKTRLCAELARDAGDGLVLYGGCEDDAVVAYQPFVEALRQLARSAPAGALRLPSGAGAAQLAALVPELAAAETGAAPAAAEPETLRYLLYEAVATVLTGAAEDAPVLLVLDDLHWADHSTLRLLRHVVRSRPDAGLLVVGTYRDGEVPAGHPLTELAGELRRAGGLERITLGGLDQAAVDSLIEDHAGRAAPAALGRTIREETDGNPFFVEEVVRNLVESGADLDAAGRAAHAPTGGVAVPEGVKEVLGLRLARLSPACRTVLAHAAVLGREFRLDVLTAMAGGERETTIAALEEALGARLVVERDDAGEPRSAFVHALVRETLYEGLSAARRQDLHARAADAIEAAATSDPDARIAALAVHGRLAGAAWDPEKGLRCSLEAGSRARERFAWHEAIDHLDGALQIMERTGAPAEARGRLLVGLAELSVVIADLGRHIGYLERAMALFAQAGDDERVAQVHSRLGVAHAHVDSIHAEHLDLGRAFAHFDAARAILGRGPARTSRGHLETGVAWAQVYALRIDAGRDAARRAMEIADRSGDELLWTSAAQPFAWHCIVGGRLREGFDALERAFAIADRHRRSFPAFMAANTRGQLTWGLGAPGEALPFLARPLDLPYVGRTAFRQEIADGVGRCRYSTGDLAGARRELADARAAWISHALAPLIDLWDGAWDRVDALAARVLATSRRTGNRWDEWAAHHLAARVLALRGRPGEAAARLAPALEIVAGGGAAYFELWVRPDLARALAALGRTGEARAHTDRCLAVVGAGEDWRGRAGEVALADAVVLAAEDRIDEAAARFAAAEATFLEHRLVPRRAECLHEWGRSLLRAGDGAGADRLAAARELYVRHGAGRAWLERLDAASTHA